MSEKSDDNSVSNSKTDEEKEQMLFNTADKEGRSKRDSADEEDKMDEFNTWTKKYHRVSKEIRKNAIEQEKKELQELEKSPLVRYYEGTRVQRIQALDEEQKQQEAMEAIKLSKGKK